MKNIKSIIALLLYTQCLISSNTFDSVAFVYNEQGATLRIGQDLESRELVYLSFGDTINLNYNSASSLQRDTLNGESGYWIPAKYKNQKGYIFSGRVHTFKKYAESNNDYSLLFNVDYTLPLVNLDKFSWFGFYIDSISLEGKFEILNLKYQKSNFYNHDPWGEYNLYSLDYEAKNDIKFILGTTSKFEEILVRGFIKGNESNREGEFLFPYQALQLRSNPDVYLKSIIESFTDPTYNHETQKYKIVTSNLLEVRGRQNVELNELEGNEIYFQDAEKHCIYQSPTIFWTGDINLDGCLDVILRSTGMNDKCGGGCGYSLFMSKNENSNYKLIYSGGGGYFYEHE